MKVEPSFRQDKDELQRKRSFNNLSAKEWTILSRNVWNDLSSPREKYQLEHGAVFPLKLAERIIKIYSKPNDIILDPFLGTGTTVIAAYRQGRSAIGIELVEKFYNTALKWLNKEKQNLFDSLNNKNLNYKILLGDCRILLSSIEKNSIQLTFTSPPYANFIQKSINDRKKTHKKSRIALHNNSVIKQYSEMKEDFGNLDYAIFLTEVQKILKKNLKITKPGGYSVWVVKDYRDTKNKIPYIEFHSDLAKQARKAGWLYQDLIIWDQNEQRSLVLLGYPSVFYSNQNCTFIVVFRKKNEDK